MASIQGSQFNATAGNTPVTVVTTTDGSNLPPPVGGQFNLEVWTGGSPPTMPAPGYQGLAVLGFGGFSIDLVSGAFQLQDTGSTFHILTADGNNETIQGGPNNNDLFYANGNNDVVIGGGQDIIIVNGNADTVNGVGNDVVLVYGSNAVINGGTGNDTIVAFAGSNHDTINAQSGNDLIVALGSNAVIDAGTGNDTIVAVTGSTGDTITAHGGNDVIYVIDAHNTVIGGSGSDMIGLYASNNAFTGQTGGHDSIQAIGNNETVDGGASTDSILAVGNNDVITAGSGGTDTILAIGNGSTISGGTAPNALITVYGNNNAVNLGTGNTQATVDGTGNQVFAGVASGTNHDTVTFDYGSATFNDGGNLFADTVIGFSQSSGDRIHLAPTDTVASSSPVNSGQDTLITLSDNSTILLKGVTHIDNTFFS